MALAGLSAVRRVNLLVIFATQFGTLGSSAMASTPRDHVECSMRAQQLTPARRSVRFLLALGLDRARSMCPLFGRRRKPSPDSATAQGKGWRPSESDEILTLGKSGVGPRLTEACEAIHALSQATAGGSLNDPSQPVRPASGASARGAPSAECPPPRETRARALRRAAQEPRRPWSPATLCECVVSHDPVKCIQPHLGPSSSRARAVARTRAAAP